MKLGIILQSNKPEHAWNTFRKVRGKEEIKVCPTSTMSDLLKMVENSDKVLVFS